MGGVIKKQVSIYYKEEMVHGKLFTYRLDIVNGTVKENWVVDEKSVGHDQYEQEILEAEKEERRIERENERGHHLKIENLKHEARMAGQKKLLQEVILELERIVNTVKEHNLELYLQFKPETIGSKEQYDSIVNTLLPEAHDVLDNSDYKALQESWDELQEYPARMRLLLYETINHVIRTVDDTQFLKKLLELLDE